MQYESIPGLIIKKTRLSSQVNRLEVYAPHIARRRKPGQFVVVRVTEGGERIPLTIADANSEYGVITLVVQEAGKTTATIARMQEGDSFLDILGPLGTPTHIEKVGKVWGVAGGVGIAMLHPVAQAMKAVGNEVVSILGARTKGLIPLREEMERASSRVDIWTNDGSEGRQGLVIDGMKAEFSLNGKPDLCIAVGPLVMMRAVSETTRPWGVKTLVSLNSIMVDGTGMCGGCRATVHGKTVFVCVEGPEVDGHGVDFEELMQKQQLYRAQEQQTGESYRQETHECRLRSVIGED